MYEDCQAWLRTDEGIKRIAKVVACLWCYLDNGVMIDEIFKRIPANNKNTLAAIEWLVINELARYGPATAIVQDRLVYSLIR